MPYGTDHSGTISPASLARCQPASAPVMPPKRAPGSSAIRVTPVQLGAIR